jgi:hypothetical protein
MNDIGFAVWKRHFGTVSFEKVAEKAGVEADSLENCSEEELELIENEIQVNPDYEAKRITDAETAVVFGEDGTPLT